MALILRLDIDKPYGRSSLLSKIKSKAREDFYFPALAGAGYLDFFWNFTDELKSHGIPAHIYFRLNTLPLKPDLKRLSKDLFAVGLHTEDTRSKDSFLAEVEFFSNYAGPMHSFSKHGSGQLKLGRRHYAPYEEDKYQAWSKDAGIPFYFGNGIGTSAAEWSVDANGFFPKMFWIDDGYRDLVKQPVSKLIEAAQHQDVVVIMHPENFYLESQVKDDFMEIVRQAKAKNIPWKLHRP